MTPKSPKYRYAVLATDVAAFSLRNGTLQVLLIQMKKSPFTGRWALPGGLIKIKETPEHAARHHLAESTGLTSVYLEQLYTFGKVDRDPFGRVVSVAYLALLRNPLVPLKTASRYSDIRWFPVNALPRLAYDHMEIVQSAVERLRAKLTYTNIVCNLLPKEFTLTELQKSYEHILHRPLDKRNFRKKLQALKLIVATGKRQQGVANRPAILYRFAASVPTVVEIL